MLNKQFLAIETHIHSIFATVYGWILIAGATLWSFIRPEIFPLSIVFFAVLVDMFWGIFAAIKQKKFIFSESIRDTFIKIIIYATSLLLILLTEKVIHEKWEIATRVSCALAAACEFWSISANMLIVKPDMPFLRLFRLQLKGEIEKKVGKNIDEILIINDLKDDKK